MHIWYLRNKKIKKTNILFTKGFPKICFTETSHRDSHQMCSIRKDVLTNFVKFTGKHLCQSLFSRKLQASRTPLLQNTFG